MRLEEELRKSLEEEELRKSLEEEELRKSLEEEVLQKKMHMRAAAGFEGEATIVRARAQMPLDRMKQAVDRSKTRAPEEQETRTGTGLRMQWSGQVRTAMERRSTLWGVAHSPERKQRRPALARGRALPEALEARNAKLF